MSTLETTRKSSPDTEEMSKFTEVEVEKPQKDVPPPLPPQSLWNRIIELQVII